MNQILKWYNKILLFFVILPLITGCTVLNSPPGLVTIDSTPNKAVSITIPIHTNLFNKQAVVLIDLLNAEQLAIDEANPVCVIMGSGSGVISTQCPPGTVYKSVTPEEFTFRISDIGDQIEVTSSRLKVGEKFHIIVAGQSADGCNTTTTRYTGVADGETIGLKDLLWATTAMACLTTP